jgi:hypothetical protein
VLTTSAVPEVIFGASNGDGEPEAVSRNEPAHRQNPPAQIFA